MSNRLMIFPPVRKLNSAVFRLKTNRWRFISNFLDGEEIEIDRPIFLIGTQNGGLTLVSRMLHRHPNAISVSGDHKYWAGEDEAQDALADIMPEDFGWRKVDIEGFAGIKHSWVYANDRFLPYYRRSAGMIDAAAGARYRRIVQGILRQHGEKKRFVDKSQSLTVRVGALQEILSECTPFFVLISRNPYAVVWGQVKRNRVLQSLQVSDVEKVTLAAQHWRNSMQAALDDAASDREIKLRHWSFESILLQPEVKMAEICDFTELNWQPEILPGPHDKIPWGSRYDAFNKRKWYPLRPQVNDKYLAEIPDWAIEIVLNVCGNTASKLGYSNP